MNKCQHDKISFYENYCFYYDKINYEKCINYNILCETYGDVFHNVKCVNCNIQAIQINNNYNTGFYFEKVISCNERIINNILG